MRILLSLALLITVALAACSKDKSSDPNQYTIEYRITGATNQIAQAYIFDKNMNNREANLNNQGGTSWSQTVKTSIKPFTANMMVVVRNQLEHEYMFTLDILVRGELKKSISKQAPPGVNTTARLEYLIE